MAVPALVYGVLALDDPGVAALPRAPSGRIDEAREVLRKVLGNIDRGRQDRADPGHAAAGARGPAASDLRGPRMGLLPIVWVGIGLSVFQQFVGINVIFYYSSVLWQAVGFSEADSLIITVITSDRQHRHDADRDRARSTGSGASRCC